MGGGDLNLKKSWHPHTMKNQEKVWKAEQAKSQEQQKLNDLRREIEAEKNREELKRIGQASGVLEKSENDKKLEWMYKSSAELVSRDEYLLGRTVDKAFDLLQDEEKQKEQNLVGVKVPVNHVEHECIPFSIRSYRNLESTEQVDLQRKMLEDPLMLIKQREMEARKKLLENPVKLKELHRILKRDEVLKNTKVKAKKDKKSKRSKKSKKKRRKSESSSESSSSNESDKDLDKELEKRYKKLKGSLTNPEEELGGLNLTKLLDAKYETISKELDKAVKSKKSNRERSESKEPNSSRYSNSHERGRNTRDGRGNREMQRRSRSRQRSRSQQRSHRRDQPSKYSNTKHTRRRSRSSSHSAMNEREHHLKYRGENKIARRSRTPKRNIKNRRTRSRSTTPVKTSIHGKTSNRKYTSSSTINPRSDAAKLSNEEKEKRLKEMMQNASWRDEERTKSVHKHREEYAREEKQHHDRDFDKEFINKQFKDAMSNHTSVGSRIRSKLNNIQRTSAAMNSNFARK